MKPVQDAFHLLEQPKRIFITTHFKPDGDAVGSMLALYHYLRQLGHQVTAVSPSDIPAFLGWMPGVEHLYNYEAESARVIRALKEAELIFGLDFNDFSRTKYLGPHLEASPAPKILIDHHLLPAPVWDYGMTNPAKSSTCEMVYDFIYSHNGEKYINNDIAACLYTGVMTDTGSFRFPATTASSHAMIADLKEKGLEHSPIHEAVYDSWSLSRMQFLGYILLNKMEIFPSWNAGLICISRSDIKTYNISTGDTEGLVNYPLSISGIRFSTLITEHADEVKLSFRSKGDFDVSEFARRFFHGGGHFNASGGRSGSSFQETIDKFKKILPDIHPGSITLQPDNF